MLEERAKGRRARRSAGAVAMTTSNAPRVGRWDLSPFARSSPRWERSRAGWQTGAPCRAAWSSSPPQSPHCPRRDWAVWSPGPPPAPQCPAGWAASQQPSWAASSWLEVASYPPPPLCAAVMSGTSGWLSQRVPKTKENAQEGPWPLQSRCLSGCIWTMLPDNSWHSLAVELAQSTC